MKKTIFVIILVLATTAFSRAEVLILEGGYYIGEVKIIGNISGNIEFEFAGQKYQLDNKYIIAVDDRVPCDCELLDIDALESYAEMADPLADQRIAEKKREAKRRAKKKRRQRVLTKEMKSIEWKIGLGIGRDFGAAGINFEGMFSEAQCIYIGVGTANILFPKILNVLPKACLGFRNYFGYPGDRFRLNVACSFSNGIITNGYDSYIYPDFSTTVGLQSRITEGLCLDISGGFAVGFIDTKPVDLLLITPAINAGLLFNF